MTPPDTFTTDRLLARRPRREDAPAIFDAWASDPMVTRYMSWKAYREVDPLADFLQIQVNHWETHDTQFPYMLCLKDTDTPIGSIDIAIHGYKAEIGYVLSRAHWGQGLMTEALSYLLAWAMTQPDIFRACAFCDVENPASARVMEKTGMVREGILRRYHIAPNISPEPRDCIMCAKVR